FPGGNKKCHLGTCMVRNHHLGSASFERDPTPATRKNGALAQLGERLHGMQEVSGSIPLGSTISPLSVSRMLALSAARCECVMPLLLARCLLRYGPYSGHPNIGGRAPCRP